MKYRYFDEQSHGSDEDLKPDDSSKHKEDGPVVELKELLIEILNIKEFENVRTKEYKNKNEKAWIKELEPHQFYTFLKNLVKTVTGKINRKILKDFEQNSIDKNDLAKKFVQLILQQLSLKMELKYTNLLQYQVLLYGLQCILFQNINFNSKDFLPIIEHLRKLIPLLSPSSNSKKNATFYVSHHSAALSAEEIRNYDQVEVSLLHFYKNTKNKNENISECARFTTYTMACRTLELCLNEEDSCPDRIVQFANNRLSALNLFNLRFFTEKAVNFFHAILSFAVNSGIYYYEVILL